MPSASVRLMEGGRIREASMQGTETVYGAIGTFVFPEPTAEQRMKLIEASHVLEFWAKDEEDIYTIGDGESICHASG